ncbi:MarR family transcriptional regulator [Spongisporangium articulatum]|uniref:MarR family transcriptional regulator n=1 Tax=Spongisporangium articulatum TaxID=3362603 RepID=A0ABW8ALG6_9ACTN
MDTATPTGAPTESAVRAGLELRSLFSRLRRRMREVARDSDLTPSQTAALTRLHKEGPAGASALAAAEGVRPQSMATVVAALEQKGLVRREQSPDDGRSRLVTLTDAGRARAEGDVEARREWLAHAMQERLDETERATVREAIALLERLVTP